MLLSILISLTPTHSAPVLGPLGRPVQAWFLNQVTLRDPQMGKALHDEDGLRPYTVSTLLDDRGRALRAGSWLDPGHSVWLRITTFQEELSDLMLTKVLPRLPNRLELYKMEFRVDGYTLDPAQHPWAGQCSVEALGQQDGVNNGSGKVRLDFSSPTAFRSSEVDYPLPDPGRILRSYWQKWNAIVPDGLKIQDVWPAFASNCVVVNELTGINTERWTFAEGTRGSATGYKGVVGLTLLEKRKCGEWSAYWEGAADVLHLLAAFSFYCGTGHHTTIGLGQTRMIPLAQEKRPK